MCFLIYLILSSHLMGEITFVLMRFENKWKGKTEFSLIILLLWYRNHSRLSTKWSPQGKTISVGVIGCSGMCISRKGNKVKDEDGENSVFSFFQTGQRKEGSIGRREANVNDIRGRYSSVLSSRHTLSPRESLKSSRRSRTAHVTAPGPTLLQSIICHSFHRTYVRTHQVIQVCFLKVGMGRYHLKTVFCLNNG